MKVAINSDTSIAYVIIKLCELGLRLGFINVAFKDSHTLFVFRFKSNSQQSPNVSRHVKNSIDL